MVFLNTNIVYNNENCVWEPVPTRSVWKGGSETVPTRKYLIYYYNAKLYIE